MSKPFMFQGHDGMYVAYPLLKQDLPTIKWQQRVEFLFSQIFGTAAVLATSAAVYYLIAGNGPLCVASAVLSSFCTSWFRARIRG